MVTIDVKNMVLDFHKHIGGCSAIKQEQLGSTEALARINSCLANHATILAVIRSFCACIAAKNNMDG